MRHALVLIPCLLLGLFAAPLFADNDAPTAPVAPAAPLEEKESEAEKAAQTPTEALADITKQLRAAVPSERRELQKSLSKAYLDSFDGDESALPPPDRFALAAMRQVTGNLVVAASTFADLIGSDQTSTEDKDRAVLRLTQMLRRPDMRKAAGAEGMATFEGVLEGYLEVRTEEDGATVRALIYQTLAGMADAAGEHETAVEMNMKAAREAPQNAAAIGRNVSRILLSQSHPLDGYDAVRAQAKTLFDELRALGQKSLDEMPEGAEEKMKTRAEAVVKALETADAPFELLGRPAPAWTLVKAFGDVKALDDVKGKVVVVDFWATWCGWCIRSFPAIRTLLDEHKDDSLVLLGVTTPMRYVFASRFDLDDDLKDKAEPGARPKPAAVLEGGRNPGPGIPVLPEEEYRKKELEVLGQFIENHEMTWPVLVIAEGEPKEKYGLMGWPHAMVLDKQGRIRFFKVGALLKERPDQVAALEKKLGTLLAEDVR